MFAICFSNQSTCGSTIGVETGSDTKLLREYVTDRVMHLSIEREAKFGLFVLPILIEFRF
jgi:hypothetical protein